MHVIRTLLLVLVVLGIATASFAAKVPKSYIINSKHDFTVGGTFSVSVASYSKCHFCHIAHKFSSDAGPAKLLWNHELSASNITYGAYSNPESMNAQVFELGGADPGNFNVSNMCLSCHDGTVAIADTYLTLRQGDGLSDFPQTATLTSSGTPNITDRAMLSELQRTHPVNFTYDAALATLDGGLATPQDLLAVDANREIPLYDGKVQCGSCHDPHNGSAGMFARNVTNAPGGSFCLVCHL